MLTRKERDVPLHPTPYKHHMRCSESTEQVEMHAVKVLLEARSFIKSIFIAAPVRAGCRDERG